MIINESKKIILQFEYALKKLIEIVKKIKLQNFTNRDDIINFFLNLIRYNDYQNIIIKKIHDYNSNNEKSTINN